jgi:hypothetical protein
VHFSWSARVWEESCHEDHVGTLSNGARPEKPSLGYMSRDIARDDRSNEKTHEVAPTNHLNISHTRTCGERTSKRQHKHLARGERICTLQPSS